MYLGSLQYRITLLAPLSGSPTATGELLRTFSPVATVWASWNYGVGNEQYLADEKTTIQKVAFTIRYRNDVTTEWRILYKGITYEVNAVAEYGRRQGLILSSFARGQESTL